MNPQIQPEAASDTTGRAYLLWESPDRSSVVRFSSAFVQALNRALATQEAASPVRGVELGGLLLGRIEESLHLTVWVENFEPYPLDPQAGPSWRPGSLVAGALAARAAAKQHPMVVGMFRSHTRKDLFLDDEDQRLRRLVFDNRAGVFLLAKPFHTKETEAGVQVWRRSGALLNKPLGVLEMGRMPTLPVAPQALTGTPEIEEFEQDRRRGRMRLFYAAAILVLLLGCFLYWRSPQVLQQAKAVQNSFGAPAAYKQEPPPAATSAAYGRVDTSALAMGLQASFRNDQLTIRWNPAAPVLRDAHYGRLLVIEGTHEQAYVLGPVQFQLGMYSCPREPFTPDLTPPETIVRLEVALGAKYTVSEQLVK